MDELNFPAFGPTPVPRDHPLRSMFADLVERAFQGTLGLRQEDISLYLANLLTEFAHCDNLYRIRNAVGQRLTRVADMLMEADMSLNATSFDHERLVHKHIGDFTLFWAGVYPEALTAQRSRQTIDHLIDYVRQGKQSYYIVSTFEHGRYASDARLFRQLSEEFDLCRYGLSLVRREWERIAVQRRI